MGLSRSKSLVAVPERSVVPYYRHSVPQIETPRPRQETQLNIATLFDEERPLRSEGQRDHDERDGKVVRPVRKKSHTQTAITKDSMSVVLSALYCKLLVVLGLALPITQVISRAIPLAFYNGFYVYLYAGSLAFIISLHIIRLKSSLLGFILRRRKNKDAGGKARTLKTNEQRINNYGSFYLRLGAAAFGIGSMVYSGLEFGEYFVMESTEKECKSFLMAIKSALRMAFTVLQLHFIFLNDASMDTLKNQVLLRFSLGHMLATNLCEWLSVIVEETKHEIDHLSPKHNLTTQTNQSGSLQLDCLTDDSPGILIRDASSYLFPCTIEYSLICAVTLLEMWKDVRIELKKGKMNRSIKINKKGWRGPEYSVDCSHSQQGLVLGLVTTAYTLVSLVVFFSLREAGGEAAHGVVTLCEALIYLASLLAMAAASLQMRRLPYCLHRLDSKGSLRLGLDLTLLLKAQAGIYMFNMFSGLACWLTPSARVWPDVFSVVQTTTQTVFILNTWWKRCRTWEEQERKPGREMLTYLRVVNMALWVISITEKNRAQLRPTQLAFFGTLTWTVITHVSMPLAIFYRFHSAICLFEIWRNAYRSLAAPIESRSLFA